MGCYWKRQLRTVGVLLVALALLAGLGGVANAQAATEVEGMAHGLAASGFFPIAPTPSVQLPAGGGQDSDSLAALDTFDVGAGGIVVSTRGSLSQGEVASSATVGKFHVSDFILAKGISSAVTTTCGADGQPDDSAATTVGSLTVLGHDVDITGGLQTVKFTIDRELQLYPETIPAGGTITVDLNLRGGSGGGGHAVRNATALYIVLDSGDVHEEFWVGYAEASIGCAAPTGQDSQQGNNQQTGDRQTGKGNTQTGAGNNQQAAGNQQGGTGTGQQAMVTKTFRLTLNGNLTPGDEYNVWVVRNGKVIDVESLCGVGATGRGGPVCEGNGHLYTASTRLAKGSTITVVWRRYPAGTGDVDVFFRQAETLNGDMTDTAWFTYGAGNEQSGKTQTGKGDTQTGGNEQTGNDTQAGNGQTTQQVPSSMPSTGGGGTARGSSSELFLLLPLLLVGVRLARRA